MENNIKVEAMSLIVSGISEIRIITKKVGDKTMNNKVVDIYVDEKISQRKAGEFINRRALTINWSELVRWLSVSDAAGFIDLPHLLARLLRGAELVLERDLILTPKMSETPMLDAEGNEVIDEMTGLVKTLPVLDKDGKPVMVPLKYGESRVKKLTLTKRASDLAFLWESDFEKYEKLLKEAREEKGESK